MASGFEGLRGGLCLLALAACSSRQSAPPEAPPAAPEAPPAATPEPAAPPKVPVTDEELAAFARASNAFAFDVYGAAPAGNLVFSPASLSLALTMTWAGARGETADEMARVLRLEGDDGARHAAAGRILASFNAGDALRVVNRLYGEQAFGFDPAFLTLLRESYGAPFSPVDFAGDAETQRARINGDVADFTRQRIPELLPAGSLDGLTRLVLVNAITFLASWEHEFDPAETRPEPFLVNGTGPAAPAPLMRQTRSLRYAETGGAQVVELPYGDGAHSMVLVVPREPNGLPAIEGTLGETFAARRTPRPVRLTMPRWTFEGARLPLLEVLPALGMRRVFDADAADLTGMAPAHAGGETLYVKRAFHEAFVKVDEEGTEAAAATAVVVASRSAARPVPPVTVRADHPFAFAIVHRVSGTILFLGRVANPAP
ncbi:MAG: serpin family protein [Myxococcota bacterium]